MEETRTSTLNCLTTIFLPACMMSKPFLILKNQYKKCNQPNTHHEKIHINYLIVYRYLHRSSPVSLLYDHSDTSISQFHVRQSGLIHTGATRVILILTAGRRSVIVCGLTE